MKTPANELGQKDAYRVMKTARDVFPRVLPDSWTVVQRFENATHYRRRGDILVLAEVELVDGELWLHMSVSQAIRIPTWEELREAKDVIFGLHRKAVQVLPAQDEYVNINPRVLHLYACLDRDPLPDFRMPVEGIDKPGI